MNGIALVAMVAAGTLLPLMDIIFGKFVNVFDDFVNGKLSPSEYRSEVAKYRYVLILDWLSVVADS